jgi:hypothetical protein
MSVRTCPDWPVLMEVAPDLQFKHYTASEAKLPAEAQMKLTGLDFDEAEVCADLDHYVYNAEHTHPEIVAALVGTHWSELRDPTRPHEHLG